MLKILLNRYW